MGDRTLTYGTGRRERGPLFLSGHRRGPHRLGTTDPHDICPETGRARLGHDRSHILLTRVRRRIGSQS